MEQLDQLEIIQINTVDGKLQAILSYRDKYKLAESFTNGFCFITVPVNIRALQLSAYGNVLVDQSVKDPAFQEPKASF